MSETIEYRIHPLGWEADPEEERIRFSTLDYLAACTYNSYGLFFRLSDDSQEQKARVVETLKVGLERTLAQCRQLVGTIEKNTDDDDHSFVRKRDSTVKFIVKSFDETDGVPSLSDIQKTHFASSHLGDTSRFAAPGMAYGEKPSCLPSAHPIISAFQANFIPGGGLIFVTNFHHYANDIMGWSGFIHQLASNCHAHLSSSPPPPWDPANLDSSRFTSTSLLSASKVPGPTPPSRHPDLRPNHVSLLFHLPPAKAAQLKALVSSTLDLKTTPYISTYDALCALLFRLITRHRMPIYNPPPTSTPLLLEGVNLRPRTSPPLPPQHQRNHFFAASSASISPPLTISDILASATSPTPLSTIASTLRQMTDSITPYLLDQTLAQIAPIKDKTSLFTRVNSFPPLSVVITDWRDGNICDTDFGFGEMLGFRHFFGEVTTEGLVVIYPARKGEGEGVEIVVAIEEEAAEELLGDEEGRRWLEFRGWEVRGGEKGEGF